MGKRFKRYDFALKMWGTDDATATPPKPNTKALIYEYWNYRQGNKQVSYTRAATSNTGGLKEISVIPFMNKGAAKWKAEISNRVADKVYGSSNVLGTDIKSELTIADPPDAAAEDVGNFEPAKAIITKFTSDGTSTASKITGIKYNKRKSETYVCPFGDKATASDYITRLQAIETAVANATADMAVTFKAERWERGRM